MPSRPLSQCTVAGCPNLVARPGKCWQHQRETAIVTNMERRRSPAYGRAWRRKRHAWLRDNPYCVVCGAPATDVDHIIPLAAGGADDAANYQSMCSFCHKRKTAAEDGGFGNGRKPRG